VNGWKCVVVVVVVVVVVTSGNDVGVSGTGRRRRKNRRNIRRNIRCRSRSRSKSSIVAILWLLVKRRMSRVVFSSWDGEIGSIGPSSIMCRIIGRRLMKL